MIGEKNDQNMVQKNRYFKKFISLKEKNKFISFDHKKKEIYFKKRKKFIPFIKKKKKFIPFINKRNKVIPFIYTNKKVIRAFKEWNRLIPVITKNEFIFKRFVKKKYCIINLNYQLIFNSFIKKGNKHRMEFFKLLQLGLLKKEKKNFFKLLITKNILLKPYLGIKVLKIKKFRKKIIMHRIVRLRRKKQQRFILHIFKKKMYEINKKLQLKNFLSISTNDILNIKRKHYKELLKLKKRFIKGYTPKKYRNFNFHFKNKTYYTGYLRKIIFRFFFIKGIQIKNKYKILRKLSSKFNNSKFCSFKKFNIIKDVKYNFLKFRTYKLIKLNLITNFKKLYLINIYFKYLIKYLRKKKRVKFKNFKKIIDFYSFFRKIKNFRFKYYKKLHFFKAPIQKKVSNPIISV